MNYLEAINITVGGAIRPAETADERNTTLAGAQASIDEALGRLLCAAFQARAAGVQDLGAARDALASFVKNVN